MLLCNCNVDATFAILVGITFKYIYTDEGVCSISLTWNAAEKQNKYEYINKQ